MALNDVVASGQPIRIPAQDWNDILYAARLAKQGEGGEPEGGDGDYPTIIAKVRNDSGVTLDRFSVVGLGAPIISPTDNLAEFKRQPSFKVVKPVTGTHENKAGVLLEPLTANAIGVAFIPGGVVPARLTGTDVGFAAITNGSTVLTASATGTVRVLWADSGSSERWALVSASGGSSLEVKESDSSPDYTGISMLIAHADDFVLTQPAAGQAQLKTKGLTETLNIVTAVSCNAGVLSVTTKSMVVRDGLIVSIT